MRKDFYKKIAILLIPFMVFSCGQSGNTTPSSSSDGLAPVSTAIEFDFDSHDKEYITNKSNGNTQKVDYLFNESNANKIFKAPSDPLFKEGVGKSGTSLYMDGHSTKMRVRNLKSPKNKLSITCWIAPRGFENPRTYGGSFCPGRAKLTSILNKGNIEIGQGFLFGYGRLGIWGIQMCLKNKSTGENFYIELYDQLNSLKLYEWNHLGLSYDGDTGYFALFYNGERAYESYHPDLVNTEIVGSSEDYYVGYYVVPDEEKGCNRQLPAGLMDNFKMYMDTLTPGHIIRDYKEGCRDGKHPSLDFSEVQEDRAQYEGDRYRPIYHGVPNAVWMNEPHAPIYYKGMYHLFYQHNPIGPYWYQIRWGHFVSTDLVHWVGVKDAVVQTPGICPEGVWTGGSVIGPDGTPWLAITAGTTDTTWTGQNITYAHCVDPDDPYLTDWVVEDKVTLTQPAGDSQGEREQFRDPFVWYDDGMYYMMVSTSIPGQGGSANVYTSPNMRDWVYHGYLYQCPFDKYPVQGAHWECVVMFPISSKDGSKQKWILFDCPQYTSDGWTVDCIYWVGNFDKKTCKFTPEDYYDSHGNLHDGNEPRLFDYGHGTYTGQTGFCYLTEEDKANGKTRYEEGRTVLISLAQGKDAGTGHNINAGWAHNLAMPVNLYLADDGYTVIREVIPELQNANHTDVFSESSSKTVDQINSLIEDIRGDSLEIKFKATINETNYKSGLYVRYNKNTVKGVTERSAITLENNELYVNRLLSSTINYVSHDETNRVHVAGNEFEFTILLDRSQLEVYVNGVAQITTRVYPYYGNSDYLKFFDEGGNMKISNLSIKSFGSVYYETTTPSYYGNTGNLGE